MKNRILKTIFACAISMGLTQKACSMELAKQVCSSVFGLHPLLVATVIGSFGAGVGALYMVNKKAEQPAILKHGLRAGIIGAVGYAMTKAENYLHNINGFPTHKLAFAGHCVKSLGLGLVLLKGTDMLSNWTAGKLGERKCTPYVKNMIKVAGYLVGLYVGGIALVDSYGFTR